MMKVRSEDKPALVVVANARKAEIYSQAHRFSVPEKLATLKAGPVMEYSDQQGRTFDSSGGGRHKMESKTSPKKQALENFIGVLNHDLEARLFRGDYCGFMAIAPPAFLGELRRHASKALQHALQASLAKDIVGTTPEDLLTSIKSIDGIERL